MEGQGRGLPINVPYSLLVRRQFILTGRAALGNSVKRYPSVLPPIPQGFSRLEGWARASDREVDCVVREYLKRQRLARVHPRRRRTFN